MIAPALAPYPEDFLPPTPSRRLMVRSTDGVRLAVQIHDPGADVPAAARTVVLVHGWTCSTTFWVRVLHRLRPHLRVVVYDLRGHGRSDAVPDGGFTPDALAADLAAVLAAVLGPSSSDGTDGTDGAGRVVVAGHSMGAMTLVAFAARYPRELHRHVAAGLLASTGVEQLMGRMTVLPHLGLPSGRSSGRPSGRPSDSPRFEALARRTIGDPRALHRLPLRLARASLVRATMSRTATPLERAFCTDIVLACPQRTYEGFAEMLATLDLSADLARLDAPVSVLVGTQDRLTPPWHARRMAAALPHPLGLVEVPGAGHMTPLTAPDAVAAVVRDLAARPA